MQFPNNRPDYLYGYKIIQNGNLIVPTALVRVAWRDRLFSRPERPTGTPWWKILKGWRPRVSHYQQYGPDPSLYIMENLGTITGHPVTLAALKAEAERAGKLNQPPTGEPK